MNVLSEVEIPINQALNSSVSAAIAQTNAVAPSTGMFGISNNIWVGIGVSVVLAGAAFFIIKNKMAKK